MPDASMNPIINKHSYIFIEPCGSLQNKDIGLFKYNGEFLIRTLILKNGKYSSGEIGLPMRDSSLTLPCGIFAKWEK